MVESLGCGCAEDVLKIKGFVGKYKAGDGSLHKDMRVEIEKLLKGVGRLRMGREVSQNIARGVLMELDNIALSEREDLAFRDFIVMMEYKSLFVKITPSSNPFYLRSYFLLRDQV